MAKTIIAITTITTTHINTARIELPTNVVPQFGHDVALGPSVFPQFLHFISESSQIPL